jgi:hypothetical protein
MERLKARWESLDPQIRVVFAVVGLVLSLLIVVKLLPFLFAAMSAGAVLGLLFVPYWIPTLIAFVRHHPSAGGIAVLNLLLGWTFIGWVVALVWALSDNSPRAGQQTVVVNTHVNAHGHTAAPAGVHPTYQVGDVVNGHRFNGHTWMPL